MIVTRAHTPNKWKDNLFICLHLACQPDTFCLNFNLIVFDGFFCAMCPIYRANRFCYSSLKCCMSTFCLLYTQFHFFIHCTLKLAAEKETNVWWNEFEIIEQLTAKREKMKHEFIGREMETFFIYYLAFCHNPCHRKKRQTAEQNQRKRSDKV